MEVWFRRVFGQTLINLSASGSSDTVIGFRTFPGSPAPWDLDRFQCLPLRVRCRVFGRRTLRK